MQQHKQSRTVRYYRPTEQRIKGKWRWVQALNWMFLHHAMQVNSEDLSTDSALCIERNVFQDTAQTVNATYHTLSFFHTYLHIQGQWNAYSSCCLGTSWHGDGLHQVPLQRERVRHTKLDSAFSCAFMVEGVPDPPTHLLPNSAHKDPGRILTATHSANVREELAPLPVNGPMPSVTCRNPTRPRSSDVFVCQTTN